MAVVVVRQYTHSYCSQLTEADRSCVLIGGKVSKRVLLLQYVTPRWVDRDAAAF